MTPLGVQSLSKPLILPTKREYFMTESLVWADNYPYAHEHSTQSKIEDLVTFDGLKLKLFLNLKNQQNPLMVVVHGVGEHALRHAYWNGPRFENVNVLLFDLRGHGVSEGERANVGDFDDYLKDLERVMQKAHELVKGSSNSIFLFGHSMGGLIVTRFLQKCETAHLPLKKVVLSAPGFGGSGLLGQVTQRIPLDLYKLAGKWKSLALGGILPLEFLSHEKKSVEAYKNDSRNSLRIHSHLYFELLAKSQDSMANTLEWDKPMLVLVAGDDQIVSKELIYDFYSSKVPNAKLITIPKAYHEMYMETPNYRDQFFLHIKHFLAE